MGSALSIAAAARTCATAGCSYVGSPRRTRAVVGRSGGSDWTSSLPSATACPVIGIAAGRRAAQACR